MSTSTKGRRTGMALVVAGLLLATLALLIPTGAATEANPTPFDGNPVCRNLGLSGFTIQTQPAAGIYTSSGATVETDGVVQDDLAITISDVVVNPQDNTATFNWSATIDDGPDADHDRDAFYVETVLVKSAEGGLRWDYGDPGKTFDTAWSTTGSIGRVSFCLETAPYGTTTSTEGTTTTTEGTTTTTEGTTTSVSIIGHGTTTTSVSVIGHGTTTTVGGGGATTTIPGGPSVQGAGATNGEGAAVQSNTAAAQALPRTGSDLTLLAIAGAVVTALGLALLARSRTIH